MGTSTRLRPALLRPRAAELRRRAATSPGRLRRAMVVAIAALLVAGLVSTRTVDARRGAAASIATRDEPLMVQAESLYASLSDADATAAATLIAGGVEAPARRQRYLAALRRASLQ